MIAMKNFLRIACLATAMTAALPLPAYAYMAKDIGFDFNNLKGPAKDLTGKILGSGLIDPTLIPTIQGLLNPMMNADWFLTLQDQSFGFVGGEVTVPIWMGGKINAANRAA